MISQTTIDGGFAGTGEFVRLLIVKPAERYINESHKSCNVSVSSQYSACHSDVCIGLMEV